MDEVEKIFGAALGANEETVSAPVGSPSEERAVERIDNAPTPEPMCRLAAFVMDNFRVNAEHRRSSGMNERLVYALDSQTLKYTSEQVGKMKAMGIDPRLFSPVTFTKVRTAKSLLCDLITSSSEPLFKLEPSPEPDSTIAEDVQEEVMSDMQSEITDLFGQLQQRGVQQIPPEAMEALQKYIKLKTENAYDVVSHKVDEEAKKCSERMQRKVWDRMHEGGYSEAFRDFCVNICTYGTGVLIGPYERVEAKNRCVRDRKTGVRKYKRVFGAKLVYESVNPCDCYPAPDALKCSDGPFCIRVKYTNSELWRYSIAKRDRGSKGLDGWNEREVAKLLQRHPQGGVKISDEQYDPGRRESENNGVETFRDCTYEGVRCFASVRGSMLREMGIVKNRDGKAIALDEFYKTETVVVGGLVLFCRIFDERLEFPISKGVFYDLPGSWWGKSIPDVLFMCQYVQNNCVKSLVQNMAVAAGPQIWVNDAQRLVSKSPDALKMHPHKVWAFGASLMGGGGAPMGILAVPSNANELLNVFDKMGRQADLDSGLPSYMEGQTSATSGAMRTAEGLKTFTEAATRQIKLVMAGIDASGICDVARRTADWLLIYDDDMDAKGDVEVRTVGLLGRILKAQRDAARSQILQMVQNSEILRQIAGVKGVVELFRPVLSDIDVNPDNIVPNGERLKELEMLEQIKQIFQAVQSSAGVNEAAGLAPDGQPMAEQQVQEPQQPQGGVEQRRATA